MCKSLCALLLYLNIVYVTIGFIKYIIWWSSEVKITIHCNVNHNFLTSYIIIQTLQGHYELLCRSVGLKCVPWLLDVMLNWNSAFPFHFVLEVLSTFFCTYSYSVSIHYLDCGELISHSFIMDQNHFIKFLKQWWKSQTRLSVSIRYVKNFTGIY